MKIVIAAMSPSRGSIVECSHQLGRAFARHGHQVLHLSTPVSPAHVVRLGRVDVWRRLRACLFGVRAEMPKAGAPELTDVELYLAWRANGLPIESPGVRR